MAFVGCISRLEMGAGAMKTSLAVDRFEGDGQQIAVLLTDDGTQINFPRTLLPKSSKPGDILSLAIVRDVKVTENVAKETRAVQDELKKSDTGGDIQL